MRETVSCPLTYRSKTFTISILFTYCHEINITTESILSISYSIVQLVKFKFVPYLALVTDLKDFKFKIITRKSLFTLSTIYSLQCSII